MPQTCVSCEDVGEKERMKVAYMWRCFAQEDIFQLLISFRMVSRTYQR